MLNAGPSAAIQIQQPVGLAQEPRYLPVRLGMDQLLGFPRKNGHRIYVIHYLVCLIFEVKRALII